MFVGALIPAKADAIWGEVSPARVNGRNGYRSRPPGRFGCCVAGGGPTRATVACEPVEDGVGTGGLADSVVGHDNVGAGVRQQPKSRQVQAAVSRT